MAYATHADIEAAVAGRSYAFGSTSKPTDAQVDTYCDQISQELDGYLEQAGYVVPVTDTGALKLLKLWCGYGVIPLVENASRPDRMKTDTVDLATQYRKMYEQALKTIQSKALNAPASAAASAGGLNDYWNANPADTDAATPIFTRGFRF